MSAVSTDPHADEDDFRIYDPDDLCRFHPRNWDTVTGEWLHNIIHGGGGMNSFETHELVLWGACDRRAAAEWAVRCLANPRSEGSREVLDAIEERRRELGETPPAEEHTP